MIEGIPYLAPAVPLVQWHHERWDGGGYPDGLRGEHIPPEARLLTVVDTFDAMTSDRPYRRALDPETALAAIVEGSATQFDPAMVQAFLRCWERGEIFQILTGGREADTAAA
jgi:HD-GYP domain-containing protein (c-di-GMP phosphodiesterase class II)